MAVSADENRRDILCMNSFTDCCFSFIIILFLSLYRRGLVYKG